MHKNNLNIIFDNYDLDSLIVCSLNDNSYFLRHKTNEQFNIINELKINSIKFNSKCTLINLIDEYLLSKNLIEEDILQKYDNNEDYLKLCIVNNTKNKAIHSLFFDHFIKPNKQLNTDLVKCFILNESVDLSYKTELIINNYRLIYKQIKILKNHSTIYYDPWVLNFILQNNLRPTIFSKLIKLLQYNPHYITVCHGLSFCVNARTNFTVQWLCKSYPLNFEDFDILQITEALDFFINKKPSNHLTKQFDSSILIEQLYLIFNSFDNAKHILRFFE